VFNNRISVMSDNVGGMQQLVEYVYSMGHRKIAYIHGADSAVTRERLASFYHTAETLGLEIPDEYIKEAPYRDSVGTGERTKELLRLSDPPTCILYPDDFASLGGLNAISELGLRVPEDISVVGYDGIRISRHLSPKLTTLKQDTKSIGGKAGEKLISLIEHPKSTLIEQIVIKGEVYEGGSVCKILK
jgi:LacI family transcriptional regulator/LacI family purine nucleotide synthesis repressor